MKTPMDKLILLRVKASGDVVSFRESGTIWASAELTDKASLFSKVGIGVRSVKLSTVPRGDLTLHDALRWKGRHLFLTSITTVNPANAEITAALIEPAACAATRPEKGKDGQGKLCYTQKPLCLFPGFLTEKYLGFVQREPQGQVEHRLVLVTPKAVTLKTGDLVNTGGGVYAVRVCYLLDEFKNEYEIANTKEP